MRELALKDYQVAYSSNVDQDIALVLDEGFKPLDRENITPFNVRPPVEWAKDPFSDRNWMYQLHSWRMLDPFFNRMSADDRAYVGDLMTDWFAFYRKNPRATGWFWYDMSTGIRASKLAFLILWCNQNSVDVPLKEWVLQDLIKTHFQHLTNPRELSSGNHGLFQLTGLMGLIDSVEKVGVYDSDLSDHKAFAIDNLSRLLREQLGFYGIHTEHSPSYHLFIATKIKQVLAAPWWNIAALDWARKLVDAAYIAKGWMLTPEMKCPPVGDSEEKIRQEKLNRMTEWPHEEFSGLLGASLDGYGVIRSKPNVPIDQSHYLFFQCSFKSGSHKHADCLSFLWQEGGQYIFHDSGKYSYQRDAVRDYFLSTRAHNCLEVDGEDYSTRHQDAYGSALKEVKPCDDGWLLHGHVLHKKVDIEHRRFLYYRPGIGVDVLDVVKNRRPGKRTYRLWWQLGPDTGVESLGKEPTFNLPNGQKLTGRFQSSSKRISLSEHRGERDPRMAGWISRAYLEYEPSTSLSVNTSTGDEYLYLISSWRLDGHADVESPFDLSNRTLNVRSEALNSSLGAWSGTPASRPGRLQRYIITADRVGARYPIVSSVVEFAKRVFAMRKLRKLSKVTPLTGLESALFTDQISDHVPLEATRVEIEGQSLSFLADSRAQNTPLKGIFCASVAGRAVLMSTDVGASWSRFWSVRDEGRQRVERLYVGSGAVFVWLRDPEEVAVLSLEGELLQKTKNGVYPWHGTQGISESSNGTVMYAEYQAGDEKAMPTLRVWKSMPPYNEWHPVLAKKAARYPEGDIRHFHGCVADPFRDGVWYVSSGDSKTHNRMWMSVDDGESWKELTAQCEHAQRHSVMDSARLLRYTSVQFDRGVLIWATDDGVGVLRSAVVRCTPDYDQGVAELEIVGFLGKDYARNLVKTSSGYLVICEAKQDKEFVEFWHLDGTGRPSGCLKKINQLAKKSPVTNSMASMAFVDGVAFFPDLGVLSGRRGGIVALKMS